MVQAGYVETTDLAFQKYLSRGQPAYVARPAPPPAEVIRQIHDARGLASLAHPGLLGHDDWIPGFIVDGLDAIEAYHSRHDAAASQRYLEMARRHGVLVSGGSDYHGDRGHGAPSPGAATLPRDAFDALKNRISHN
jgi:predicted metal-dependent phosphoesterase TrpH